MSSTGISGRPGRPDAGFTLVEMVVGMAILAVVITVSTGLLLQAGGEESRSRARSNGTSLLSQKLEDLRGTAVPAIPIGTATVDSTVDGLRYSVTTTAAYVDDSSATGDVCTSPASTVRYLRAVVVVSYPESGATKEVKAETLRSVANSASSSSSGSLAVRVTNAAGTAGVPGASVDATVNGATVATATTDATGCAVFPALSAGTYTASSATGGLVAPDGTERATGTTLGVTAGSLTRGTLALETARTATITLDPVGALVPNDLVFTLAGTLLNQTPLPTCPALPVISCASGRPGLLRHLFADTYTVQAGLCGNSSTVSATTVDLRSVSTANAVLPLGSVKIVVKKANGTAISDGRLIRFARSSASLCTLGTETVTGTVLTGSDTYALPYGTWTVTVPNNGTTSTTTTSLAATTSSTARTTTLTFVVVA